MYQLLNIEDWNRKDHFRFFSGFDFPYFDICCNIDCSKAYQQAKKEDLSFFQLYLYHSLRAANAIPAFKYRIAGQDVRIYDQVHASPTINRKDGSFGFAYIDFHADRSAFFAAATAEIDQVYNSKGLIPAVSGENVIHYSTLPWVHFTAISHARHTPFKDSIPKISFGRVRQENGKMLMPVSISVHHALMDGFHVGQYLDLFSTMLNES